MKWPRTCSVQQRAEKKKKKVSENVQGEMRHKWFVGERKLVMLEEQGMVEAKVVVAQMFGFRGSFLHVKSR